MPADQSTVYQQRKEQGLCTRCGDPAADDSSLCAPHRDCQRDRVARSMARSRDARRAAGLCIWCPGSRPTKVKEGETSCLACRIRRQRLPRSVEGVNNGVNKAERIAAMTRQHADGRTRYHGQGKRGNQPFGKLDAEDLLWARQCMDAGATGLQMLESEEVQALPRVQREDVKQAALHQLGRAQGHIEDVLERRGHFKVRHGRRDGE